MIKNYLTLKMKISLVDTYFVTALLLSVMGLHAQECTTPSAITINASGMKHARINWQSPEIPISGVDWELRQSGAEVLVQSGTSHNTSLLISDLEQDNAYIVRLRTHCDTNYSEWVTKDFYTKPEISHLEGQIGVGNNANPFYGGIYGPMLYIGQSARNGSVSNMLYTAEEFESIAIPDGAKITAVSFDKVSSASGGEAYPDLRFRMLIANSTNSAPISTDTTLGDIEQTYTEVMDDPSYDLPATTGWIKFDFNEPFEYTGNAIELSTVIYQTPNVNQFSGFINWQWTAGYSDHIAGAWPIISVPLDENVKLNHNITSNNTSYKERPNIKISYDLSNVVESVDVATLGDIPAEITENQDTLSLISFVNPSYLSQEVKWEVVSGSEFASFKDGVITAFANGTIVIKAIAADNSEIADEIAVVITNQVPCSVAFPANVEPITHVQFQGINNITSELNGGTTPAYEDFTSQIGQVSLGQQYNLNVRGNTNGDFSHYITAYIDWNRNNSFEDEGETYPIGVLINSTGTDNVTVTGVINVPADAPLGICRMRIIKKFNNEAAPCNTVGYGQAEDYSLNVNQDPVAGTDDFVNNTITIYPNPVSDILHLSSPSTIKNVEVFNSIGQSVLKVNGNELNFMSLDSGIYFLHVHINNDALSIFKIIKQ